MVHDSVSDLVNADESLPVLRAPQQTEMCSHAKDVADDLVLDSNCKYGGILAAAI